ncbi:MAG: hypothetical protein HYZ50_10925 [Deltaproteobacteria bacterium]|nr:hypothetical protein [Deltaproteobacteria bacterium]
MSSFIKRHFKNLEELLKTQSALCQPKFPSYDIGLNREFFVREVLRTHLPPYCEITSGFICDQENEPTGQVDIILFHPLSFRVNIGASDCCLSESVFTALEIKSRLTKAHFKSSVVNLANIHALPRVHLSTRLRSATEGSEAYHFNTIGTVLFGYKGYTALKCVEVLWSLLNGAWDQRPEVVYSLNPTYILVRDDYLKYEAPGILQGSGLTWIERLAHDKMKGYRLIHDNCLLILTTILSKRIQCNYLLLPNLYNYIVAEGEAEER